MKFLHFNNEERYQNVYKENRKALQSRTVAVEPVSPEDIRRLLSLYADANTLPKCQLHIGVTFCSFKDRYRKAQGREEATNKMVWEILQVRGATVTNTHIFIHLEEYKGIDLNLRLNKSTGFVTVTGDLSAMSYS